MEKLKTKNGLTIVAAVCIVISVLAGFGFLTAASGVNCMWHCMFPQYRETETRLTLGGTYATTATHDSGLSVRVLKRIK